MQSVQIIVTGRVQGVFFRVYTRKFAQSLDITGYVKNLRSGQVEILAEGSKESLKKLIHWAKTQGSPGSHVVELDEKWWNIKEREWSSFQITY
jgi:acylphosphatase